MFKINGIEWNLAFVDATSNFLKRDDGSITIGMTDANTQTIYLSSKLNGRMLERVLTHELCHAICFSYDIRIDPELEEKLCNWVANYGKEIVYILDDLLQIISRARA